VQGGVYTLVVAGALNSVVSLYYYFRIVKKMFLDEPHPQARPLRFPRFGLGAVMALSAATLFLVSFDWLDAAALAAANIFRG
jgi:NADH:ubiquinone oxidoreductase subunit 2 (subunit N)